MCKPLVARESATRFPMVCADAVPPVPGRACWTLFDDDAAGAGERGRLSENGNVCRVGLVQEDWRACSAGRRAAAGGHENWGKTRAILHGFFTHGQLVLRMAAELGTVAFKLERLALKLKSYLCSPFCATISLGYES